MTDRNAPTGTGSMRGASVDVVTGAIEASEPFSGTFGFAGTLPDGTLVRDVLGRQPLFYDPEAGTTAFSPTDIDSPALFPAGHRWDPDNPSGPSRVFSLPNPSPQTDTAKALTDVQTAIDDAFTQVSDDDLAVAFSGGVDSALVATYLDAPLYVVGFEGSTDIQAARESADGMDREVIVHEVTVDDIEAVIPQVARAIGRSDAMDVQIALPLYLVAQRVADDGYDRLALGQGADELFGGYAKIANAPDDHRVDAGTIRGARREVVETLPEQLPRDVLAIRSAGVEPVTPLLHDSVVEAALRLPESLLVSGTERKVALRRVAAKRLPDVVASRDKKAVQYGSLVAREVDRLARQDGFKRRLDDHIRQYIDSRLNET